MDTMTPEQRSKTMSSIRAISKLENKISRELWRKGLRFRRNVRSLRGTPDIAIKKYKVVIFIDSCFWHYCKLHGKIPQTNKEFWSKKFKRNRERDAEIDEYYKEKGWKVLRVWEHEVREDFEKTIAGIEDFIMDAKGVMRLP